MKVNHPVACFSRICLANAIGLAVAFLVSGRGASATAQEQPPNILLIMADDLGFSDLGCYGSEIKTPQLDQLAKNGVRFTQFYNTARCWPTRATLLTGYYPQQVRRDNLPGYQRGNRPHWAPLMPKRLKPLGYRSYHSGKWHLDGMPIQNGFDQSYYLKDQGRFFYPKIHWKNDRKLPAVDKSSGYYATTAIADHAIECLKDHQTHHAGTPFFHYLAFTAPHFPLHALPQDIKKYDDVYEAGWEKIRARRWEKIKAAGIVEHELSQVEFDIGPPYSFPDALRKLGPAEVNRPQPWSNLTAAQQKFQAKKMAIHAAMIDRMDQEIGRVLKQLRAMQAWDNTVILFLSDNGASAEIMVRADGHDPAAPPGSGPSYLCLGPGWSTVCNTPFRRHKTWVHEGGIRTPLIVHWPQGHQERKFQSLNQTPGHVIDIVPTLLDLAKSPAKPERDAPRFPGRSLSEYLTNPDPDRKQDFWWSHEGNRALRRGHLKLVAAQGDPWALYDLRTDPTEQNDLAAKMPAQVQTLEQRWQQLQSSFIALQRDSKAAAESQDK